MTDEDPDPQHRTWYRHSGTGERAYRIVRNGVEMLRLDRPNEEILRPLKGNAEWILDRDHRPLTKYQVAQICFEADRKLCFALGLHDNARKEWIGLTDNQRIAWMETGPQTPPIRGNVYKAIRKELAPIME